MGGVMKKERTDKVIPKLEHVVQHDGPPHGKRPEKTTN